MDKTDDIALIEPMKVSSGSTDYRALVDLAIELASTSEGFKRSMPAGTVRALSDLVDFMESLVRPDKIRSRIPGWRRSQVDCFPSEVGPGHSAGLIS